MFYIVNLSRFLAAGIFRETQPSTEYTWTCLSLAVNLRTYNANEFKHGVNCADVGWLFRIGKGSEVMAERKGSGNLKVRIKRRNTSNESRLNHSFRSTMPLWSEVRWIASIRSRQYRLRVGSNSFSEALLNEGERRRRSIEWRFLSLQISEERREQTWRWPSCWETWLGEELDGRTGLSSPHSVYRECPPSPRGT